MARLSDEVVERIKRDVSLVRLIESQGHKLKKHGKDLALSCPFHQDKTPSLVITPKTNLFHCFGCGEGGSVIDWVMKTQGMSFRFACELLQQDVGTVLDNGAEVVRQNTRTKLAPPLAANADHQTALKQVMAYYHETFKQAPEAQDYLRSRGLSHPELVEQFQLGFANRTLGYRLPESNRKAGAELRGKLQDIGILRRSGHEHFNGSLVIPIIDEHGVVREVYGRKVSGTKLRKGTAQHLYLPGPHDGVWNSAALASHSDVIVCEALIDAMTFWVHGFRHVTASYGTSGFTEAHLAAFQSASIKRVLIAYDRDDAGNKAAIGLAERLTREGMECFRVVLPQGVDVNEFALASSSPQESLGTILRHAEWMGAGHAPRRVETILPKPAESEVAFDPNTGEVLETPPALAALPPASQASPMPEGTMQVDADVSEHECKIVLGDRHYRIRGLAKNLSYDQMKINLLVSLGDNVHVDTLDIYHARHRSHYIKQAAIELGLKDDIIKKDLGKVLLKLESLQEARIQETLAPEEKAPDMTEAEKANALALLRDPQLLTRIVDDFERAGVVGEETNKLVGYLAGVSRKLERPLAVIIQSSSAAGKSALMDAVLNMMPEQERVQYSAMTGQSLFYMGETNLKHKILAISEEEGAENASYALKLLQSEGEVTIASTGKDPTTGNLTTQEYRVEGPVMLFLTTTAIDIDEELLNRCLVLTVNESREQTAAIHAIQRSRQTLEGLLANEDKKHIVTLHRHAQRLIKPMLVANPYAHQLTFLSDKTRTRRDHMKYLTLIQSIALLHQYQRPVKTVVHHGQSLEYLEVTQQDIEVANQLASEVLGRTLDELPPQSRKLLEIIRDWVTSQCQRLQLDQADFRFTRKDIRENTGWGNTQLKVHLGRLEDMEYVLIHRGGRGQSFVYELLYDGQGQHGQAFLMGLIDASRLNTHDYDEKKSGVTDTQSDQGRPVIGAVSEGCHPSPSPALSGVMPLSSPSGSECTSKA